MVSNLRRKKSRMSSQKGSTNSGGIGFTGLLTIAFIVLKLTGYIDWSWWWVLSPIWISFLLVLLVIFIYFCFLVWVEMKK